MPGPELTPFTSVFKMTDQHRIRRNRQTLSCTACQRRKAKCDRRQPCSTCEKRGVAPGCQFTSSGARNEVQLRLARLEEMVRGLADGGLQPGCVAGNASVARDRGKEDVRDLSCVRAGVVESAYHGQTSLAALVDNIRDIQDMLETDAADEQDGPDNTFKEPDILFGDLPPTSKQEILNSLPPSQETTTLITTYFNAKFQAVPFIHVGHFTRHYHAFIQDPSSADFLWISILFSILSIGASVLKTKDATPQAICEPTFYMRIAAQCLLAGEYLKAKTFSVEALLIHARSRTVQRLDSDSSLWALYGLAVTLAQRRGYHRKTGKISPDISPFDAEMRRRVWFLIQSSDLLLSVQTGMPPMIQAEVCDVEHPTNLADEDFDEDDTYLPAPRPETEAIPALAYVYKSKFCVVLRRIMCHLLSTAQTPYSRTLAISSELDEWYTSIPACLRIGSIRQTVFTDHNYTIMHRIMLEIMYRTNLCMLHRPFLSTGKQDPEYAVSRSTCRDAALRLLDLHIEFDREIQPGGRLYVDKYMVSSLTLYHFLVAAMVICLDLSESTDLTADQRQTRIKAMQAVYRIWLARSSGSADALHASRVLRAILVKVQTPCAASTASSSGLVGSNSGNETSSYPETPMQDVHDPYFADMAYDMDYPVNFDDIPPLESFFNTAELLDWATVDKYLRPNDSRQVT